MKAIAIFYQGRKQDTSEAAAQLVPLLRQRGYEVLCIDIRDEDEEPLPAGSRGDPATLLVGFLTELEPHELASQLPFYLERDASVWIDKRAMLQAELQQDGRAEEFLALNDIVIARGMWPRVVQVRIWVDDYYYSTSHADGIILSTATGSTAYNMAVGGPLLHPQVQSSVLTPIAPHLASDRSLILQPEARVKLQIFTGSQHGVFSADGQMNREIQNGAVIMVKKSPSVTQFLRRRPPTYFYQIIKSKLRSDDDLSASQ